MCVVTKSTTTCPCQLCDCCWTGHWMSSPKYHLNNKTAKRYNDNKCFTLIENWHPVRVSVCIPDLQVCDTHKRQPHSIRGKSIATVQCVALLLYMQFRITIQSQLWLSVNVKIRWICTWHPQPHILFEFKKLTIKNGIIHIYTYTYTTKYNVIVNGLMNFLIRTWA